MLTLGIDTATEMGCVALCRGHEPVGELSFPAAMSQSERLLPAIESLLGQVETKAAEIELIAVSLGPGSFTGLRIGIATAKGLGRALGRPVVGIATMESYIDRVDFWSGPIFVLIYDRRDLVYWARFESGEPLGEERSDPIEAVLAKAPSGTLFVGTGAERYREQIIQQVSRSRVASSALNGPSALSIARLGWRKFERTGADERYELEPRYAQRPLAEIRSKG